MTTKQGCSTLAEAFRGFTELALELDLPSASCGPRVGISCIAIARVRGEA
jgi:hypothetical protein